MSVATKKRTASLRPTSVAVKKRRASSRSTKKTEDHGREIAKLKKEVGKLSSIVKNVQNFITSADVLLGDYELTAGEILTLESRIKKDLVKGRQGGTVKGFDGTLDSLVAA